MVTHANNSIKPPPFLYRLLSPAWFLFWLIHAFIHAFKYKEWRYFSQRLGISSIPKKRTLWIHASSVGEVNLIAPLCQTLMAQGFNLTISTFTATGFQRANTVFKQQAQIVILPMDCWPISTLFAKKLNAQCALIAETELWPETLYQVAKQETPIIHINARLSDKSLNTSNAINALLKQTLSYFSAHLTRYEKDAENFISMGVNKNKIKVLGNLKYAQNHLKPSYTNIINQPYILFASTHHNEEEQFASLLFKNDTELPLMVIAPRHPSRLDAILKSLLNDSIRQINIAVRSKNECITQHTKIYIADTLGEMNSLFQHALVVIMGGSFVAVGGHNVIEPAALGKCIITGPSDSNIKQDIIALKQHEGIIQVDNLEQLTLTIKTLLNDRQKREFLGQNAAQFVDNSQHILAYYLKEINQYLAH